MKNEFESFLSMLRRRWLAVGMICLIGIAMMPFVAPLLPVYTGTAELLVVSEALKDTTLSDPDLPSIVSSTEVLDRVIHRLGLDTDPVALRKKIKTKLPAKSSILVISYKDPNGARAAAVANAVAEEASSYFHDIAMRGYTQVLQALNRSISQSQRKVAMADRLLQRASAKNAFASSDKALDDFTSQISDLRVQRGQFESSLEADVATAEALKAQLAHISPIVHGEILQKDTIYQQVQAGFAKDVADLTSERASFHDSFPGLSALERRVRREGNQLKLVERTAINNGAGLSPSFTQTLLDGERAVATVAADRERLRATDAELADGEHYLQNVAGAAAWVGTLRSERDAALQQYVTLTQRLSTAQGDAAQAVSLGTLVVVSRAVPGPSSLPIWLAAISALIVALALSIAYAIDAIDRRLWGVREIENVYGRPVLVEVGADR